MSKRKRNSMRFTIQYKILIPFTIIIFIGLSSLLFISNNINKKNSFQTIENDMIEARKNLDVYISQYFLINNINLNKHSFIKESNNISSFLNTQMRGSVEIYDSSGKQTEPFRNRNNTYSKGSTKTFDDETSYTIKPMDDKTIVTLTYPIKSYKKIIGFVSYNMDYTDLFNKNKQFNNVIHLFAIIIFIFIFITSFILSKRITKPIRELIKGSEQISDGNYHIDIRNKSKDEMGDLADRFTIMAERIKEQIEIIESDRDTLKKVQAQNKAFFDNATHELKTPLTTILGYSQVIKDNGFTDKDFFDKGTSYIINESKRLNNLVIDILELSKSNSSDYKYDFENVNISELLQSTANELALKAQKYNITLLSAIQSNLYLKGDKYKLKEVLINIIDNAIKYGKVNSSIEISAFKKDTKIIIKVKDQGEGIAEEYIERLFEPFYRAPHIASK